MIWARIFIVYLLSSLLFWDYITNEAKCVTLSSAVVVVGILFDSIILEDRKGFYNLFYIRWIKVLVI